MSICSSSLAGGLAVAQERTRQAAATAPPAEAGFSPGFSVEETQRLVQAFSLFERLVATKPELWPGFDLKATPVAAYRPRGQAIVVGHPKPPSGRTMPTAGGRPARVITAPRDWFGGGPAEMAGVKTARLDPVDLDEESPAALMAALVGQVFRAYQSQKGAAGAALAREPDALAIFEYPDDNVSNDAGLEIENILLEQTLKADVLSYRDRARELCGLRDERRAKLPAVARKLEDDVAVALGLPVYVEVRALRAAAAAKVITPEDADESIQARLTRKSTTAGARVVDRLRRTAARSALVLDGLRPDWRAAVDGAPAQPPTSVMDDVVRKAAGGCVPTASVKQRLGYASLVADSQRKIKDEWRRREIEWGQVEAAGGRGVAAVEITAFPDYGTQRVDIESGQRIAADRRRHQRLRVDLGEAGELQYDIPVAENRTLKRFATRLPKDAKLVVDGEDVRLDLTVTRPFLEAILYGTGLQLTIHGGLLHVENGGIRIRPFPRSAPVASQSQ